MKDCTGSADEIMTRCQPMPTKELAARIVARLGYEGALKSGKPEDRERCIKIVVSMLHGLG
jgi:hypothetical protein